MTRLILPGALLAALAIPAAGMAVDLPEGWSHPTVAYDGIQVVRAADYAMEMPVHYMPPGKYRQDMQGDDGMSLAVILRQDLDVAWTLLPGGMYMEISIDEAADGGARPGPATEGVVEYEVVGKEVINGWPATRYRVLMLEDGEEADGDFWITEHWIPVRMEMRMRDDPAEVVVMEMRELNIRPQDPGLFELPPGARKLEGMQGVRGLFER